MKFSRIAITLVILAATAAGFGGWKFHAARQARAGLVALQQRPGAHEGPMAALEAERTALAQRAAAIEHDNATLAAAMEKVRTTRNTLPTANVAAASPSRREVEARLAQAEQWAQTGDPSLALRELLWCLDEGLPGLTTSNTSAEIARAARALGKLAERDPAALAALQERVEKLRQRIAAPAGNRQEVPTLAALAQAAGNEAVLLALHDQLPPGDRRRTSLAIYARDQLIAARRYEDALGGSSYRSMVSSFELLTEGTRATGPARGFAIRRAATNIEVLAGAGKLEEARELSAKVLRFDPTPETVALLQSHLTRAGQPNLLPPVEK
jgi:hypothetical protein